MTEEQNRMKLHEAVRNAKGNQTKHRFLAIAVTDQEVEILSCAAGGAYLEMHDYSTGSVSLDEEAIMRDLEERFPILLEKQEEKYPCPVCGDEKEGLFALITCLNDNHGYTRSQVADVIRPIEEAWEAERNGQRSEI
ncbi:hypothetical protein [Candidatus Manganitrophus noduliformans]|uniref:Uncharacterized protein n=1 Tax=Candidatus Manganitrophus noduliformans TaxID=2606439 RepID=A0A7X6ICT5_9BACT|nr:hypothetical protein [Candidatus Manganitrophus noduliformans]NKE72865.1 hypothetical protein [Candidatus Manganitrophus noduliformans]